MVLTKPCDTYSKASERKELKLRWRIFSLFSLGNFCTQTLASTDCIVQLQKSPDQLQPKFHHAVNINLAQVIVAKQDIMKFVAVVIWSNFGKGIFAVKQYARA